MNGDGSETKTCRVAALGLLLFVVLGLTALSDSISVYIGPSPRDREKEKRSDR